MDWLGSLKKYFALESQIAILGERGSTNRRQLRLYIGVLCGAMAKEAYDALQSSAPISWTRIAMAFIASIVVFPALYSTAGLNRGPLTFSKWCIAFQNGFFWGVTIDGIGNSMATKP